MTPSADTAPAVTGQALAPDGVAPNRLDALFEGPAIALPHAGLSLPLRLSPPAAPPLLARLRWRVEGAPAREEVLALGPPAVTEAGAALRIEPTSIPPAGRHALDIVIEGASGEPMARLSVPVDVLSFAELPPVLPCAPALLRRRSLGALPVAALGAAPPDGDARLELRPTEPMPRAALPQEDLDRMVAAGAPRKALFRKDLLAPSSVFLLHDAALLGPGLQLATRHGLVEESWGGAQADAAAALRAFAAPRAGLPRAGTVALPLPTPRGRPTGRSLRGWNHYHLHIEHLCALLQIEAVVRAWPDAGIETLLPDYDELQRAAVALLGADLGVTRPIGETELVAERVLVPSHAFHTKPPPILVGEAMRRVRRNALAEPGATPGASRVYVSRLGSSARRMRNEADLAARLAERGFAVFDARGLGYREQVLALAGARIIVGPHGAGLTNIGFAPPGALLVEAFSPFFYNGCFQALAGIVGHRYRGFVQPLPGGPASPSAEWDLDIPRFLDFLDRVLADETAAVFQNAVSGPRHGDAGTLPRSVMPSHQAAADSDQDLRIARDEVVSEAAAEGSTRPATVPQSPQTRLLPISDERRADLLELSTCDWTMHDGDHVPAHAIRLGSATTLEFGPLRVELDGGGDTCIIERREGVLSAVRLVHDGWRVSQARAFRPLIYACAFGAESQFRQTELFLRSIAEFGAYEGHVLLVTDRDEAALRPLIPGSLADRMLFVQRRPAGLFAMLNARYRLDDLPIERFQPVLYLDTDMICDAPIGPLFDAMNARPGFYGAVEYPGRSVATLGKLRDFFGDFLFNKHKPPSSAAKCVNSGSIGFPDKAFALPFFRQLLASIRGYAKTETDFREMATDQPFLGYAMQTLGAVDFDLLNRFIRLPGRQPLEPAEKPRGFVHFNVGVGHKSKPTLMAEYLASLRAAAVPAAPAIRLNRAIPGQMTDAELLRLIELARAVPPGGVIVEVGSLYGLSAWHMAKHCSPGTRVFCIDPWKPAKWIVDLVERPQNAPPFSRAAFEAFTADCDNITAIEGYSPEVARDWSLPVDLVVDDAMHNNPVLAANLSFWAARVRPGGVIAGHDYTSQWPDVIAEAEKLAAAYGTQVERVETLWSVVKPGAPAASG